MSVIYKSSRWILYSKFFASPLFVGMFVWEMYSVLKKGQFTKGAHPIDLVPLAWISISVPLFSIFVLKSIEVTPEGILIRELGGGSLLLYKDIEWVTEQRMMGRFNIFLKYFDTRTGKSKYLFTMPATNFRADLSALVSNPLGENEGVMFIRKRMAESKPEYWKPVVVSRYIVFGFLLLSMLPFVLALLVLSKR